MLRNFKILNRYYRATQRGGKGVLSTDNRVLAGQSVGVETKGRKREKLRKFS
jgi:hypothetical protein